MENSSLRNGFKWLITLFKPHRIKEANKAWREVFDKRDERVKIILEDLATYCNFNKSSFATQDSHRTAFNEGARDVFLHILEMIDITEAEVVELLQALEARAYYK